MRQRRPNRDLWMRRLAEWEHEKVTNKHGMAHLADRSIALLRAEIAQFWPTQSNLAAPPSP